MTDSGRDQSFAHLLRILKLSIEGFRGIPGKLDVDLVGPNGLPASMILAGDNGSGKSSIVDAIEFALQARIGRTQYFKGLNKPYPVSLQTQSTARVCVELTEGHSVTREVAFGEDGHLTPLGKRDPHFALSPLVLRRADILSFWSTPEESRQTLFFEYFATATVDPSLSENSDRGEAGFLRERILALKLQRRDLAGRIAAKLNVESHAVPASQAEFDVFVRQHIYKGFSAQQRQQLMAKGARFAVDHELEGLVESMLGLYDKLGSLRKKHKATSPKSNVHLDKSKVTADAMSRIGTFITGSFKQISPAAAFIERIDLLAGTISPASLSFEVTLKNGSVATPPQIFSEANLDLLALLVFLGVAKDAAAKGQAKVLILDDIFQSVDAGIRSQALDYLLAELNEWQLIVTVHDRLWREEVKHLMRRKGHSVIDREILRWDFSDGPRMYATGDSIDAGLIEALLQGQPYQVCSEAGLLLEQLSNVMSYSLPISVRRKRDDRYTLADLWPGVSKVLKKTIAALYAENVDKWMHLRNLAGAHYNEWARSLSREEAVQFGEGVHSLFKQLNCVRCHGWVAEVTSSGGTTLGYYCRCGQTKLEKV